MGRSIQRSAIAILCMAALVTSTSPSRVGAAGSVIASPSMAPAIITLTRQTPAAVITHQAAILGAADPSQTLQINMVLPLRNHDTLRSFLATQTSTGPMMSQARIAGLFLPEPSQVDAISAWANQHGLRVAAVSTNRTLVTLQGTVAEISTALSIHLNNYRTAAGKKFFSNDRDAMVPASLGVAAISGLNNYDRFRTAMNKQTIKAAVERAASGGPYRPSGFRTAYNVTHDGTGQTIGFTLWGQAVPQSDLNQFASETGDPPIVGGQPGANGIDWVKPTPGLTPAFYSNKALLETAMDVEYAHGIAPNSHLVYYLADEDPNSYDPTCDCYNPTNVGLENAIAAAASPSDPNLHVVSNSWVGGEPSSSNDPFLTTTQASFELAKAAGITFMFASGDHGSDSGGAALPAYPADSPNVISVGGTSLNTHFDSTYNSEAVWPGSGGGCSLLSANSRPSWQVFTVGPNVAPSCGGRAEPDISADADPYTGALVYVNGADNQVGGTSLATPLWAGMIAAADSYEVANGNSVLPFLGPVLYGCANNQPPYPANCRSAYQDVVSGSNGAFSAGTGWDQVTGWGSINWWNWVQDVTAAVLPPTATSTPTTIPATGSLVGSAALPPSRVNLTTEGTSDWAHWGLGSAAGFDHKANVASQIPTFIQIGGGTLGQSSLPAIFSWSDGTPDATSSGTSTAVSVSGNGHGFALTLPADPTARTVHLYVAVSAGQANLTASLSDGSAPVYSDSSMASFFGNRIQEYTITYQA
ncbi:MAG TPA: S53 family peptidase, partial [Chloroflexota bacterium]